MIGSLKKLISLLARELFPDICHFCRENPQSECCICQNCLEKIPTPQNPICPACGGENDGIFEICSKCLKENERPWKKAITLTNYTGNFMSIIKNFKYNNNTHLAKPIGHLLAKKIKENHLSADCIVPIPLHWTRQFTRGYNQTDLIASIISRNTGIPVKNLLSRIKPTPKQSRLSREQRHKNLRNAFRLNLKKSEFINFKSILLLDDVLTTGATLEAAANTLLEADPSLNINIITIARG